MNDMKCIECGATLPEGAKECPNCGCPVNYSEMQKTSESLEVERDNITMNKEREKKNVLPIVSLVLGIVIVILGCMVLSHKINAESYSANSYNADSAIFGADFYTEIYAASDTIVDELNDINSGVAIVSESITEMIGAIYYVGGMITIAIGLTVIALSIIQFRKSKK